MQSLSKRLYGICMCTYCRILQCHRGLDKKVGEAGLGHKAMYMTPCQPMPCHASQLHTAVLHTPGTHWTAARSKAQPLNAAPAEVSSLHGNLVVWCIRQRLAVCLQRIPGEQWGAMMGEQGTEQPVSSAVAAPDMELVLYLHLVRSC